MATLMLPRPNFVGIGPGKSGTTWLYKILKEHPDIALASTKETLYFDTEYHRGLDWYLRLFAGCEGARAIGEISNTYIFNAEAAARIYEFNPEMKLISCLRNPIDRAFSHYLFLLRHNFFQGTFSEVLELHPELLTRGLYARHLKPYLYQFPRNSLHIFLFDELQQRPLAVVDQVYKFLGITEDFRPPSAGKKVLAASRPRNKLISFLVKKSAMAIRAAGYPNIVHKVKESALPQLLYEPITASDYPTIPLTTRDSLSEYFHDDIQELEDMLGLPLKEKWLD